MVQKLDKMHGGVDYRGPFLSDLSCNVHLRWIFSLLNNSPWISPQDHHGQDAVLARAKSRACIFSSHHTSNIQIKMLEVGRWKGGCTI